MRYLLLLLLLLLPTGCDMELAGEDLGTVVFEVPKVPGADEPYLMPQLGPPPQDDPNSPPFR